MALGIYLSVVLLIFRAPTLSLERGVLALLIMWAGAAPSLLYLAEPPEKRAPFPLLPLTGAFYAVFFGASSFFVHFLRNDKSGHLSIYGRVTIPDISIEAQFMALLGFVLMSLTWVWVRAKLPAGTPRFTVPANYSSRRAVWLAWALLAGNFAYHLSDTLKAVPSLNQLLQHQVYVAMAIFLLAWFRGELPKWHTAAFFLIGLPGWIVLASRSSFATPTVLLAVLFLATYFRCRGTLPWKTLVCLPILFLGLYPTLNIYRAESWLYPEVRDSRLLKADAFVRAIKTSSTWIVSYAETLIAGETDALPNRGLIRLTPFNGLVQRTSLILPFSHVVLNTPEPVPYWNGETYRPLLTSWIPRRIWSGKPEERSGNAFAHRYGYLAYAGRKPNKSERTMSINIPWITELYANFGKLGIIVGMILIGGFLGFLDRFFNRAGAAPLESAIGAALLLPLFYQESNLSLMTGTLLPFAVCYWIYFQVGLRLPLPLKFLGPPAGRR